MNPEVEIKTFLDELAAHRACRQADPVMRDWQLDNLRRRLLALYRAGDADARVIDLYDRARMLMRNRRPRMETRLVALRAIFVEWRPDALPPSAPLPTPIAASRSTARGAPSTAALKD
jgi:hypothetical protein